MMMEAKNAKISDSACSLTCSNRTSQRSSSSKSRINGSDSSNGSSGYCGNEESVSESNGNKDTENSKMKLNVGNQTIIANRENVEVLNANHESLNQGKNEQINALSELIETIQNNNHAQENSYGSIGKSHQNQDGFCCIISMLDGLVLHTTSNLTQILGFPQDLWLGRSFIEFVHPKDRETFSTQITMEIALPIFNSLHKKKETTCSFYVSLRKHQREGENLNFAGTFSSYQAFHLIVNYRQGFDREEFKIDCQETFLIVLALPLHSAYTMPKETKEMRAFGMRHTASCTLSYVDADVVRNLGFLPQDMIGKSVFDFYHPEDMPMLKQVYESVLRECQISGAVYKSEPYRFAVKNGDFVRIETEWSCFVNPWSHALEFIIGSHKVLQGPENPNIFDPPKNSNKLPEDVMAKAKITQEEIRFLLSGEMHRKNPIQKQDLIKKCDTLMRRFVEDISQNNPQTPAGESVDIHNSSISERESVMFGVISPHHDYSDRESSVTPPSYNQLNYNENLQRFFESKLTTNSDAKNEPISVKKNKCDEETSKVSALQERLCNEQNSGASGNTKNCNNNLESQCRSNGNEFYHSPHLTEELLYKHNADMEKIMKQRHREQRCNIKKSKNGSHPKAGNAKKDHALRQGVKRGVSSLWDAENVAISKQQYLDTSKNQGNLPQTDSNFKGPGDNNNMNIWPLFPIPVSFTGANANMFPIYYIPAQNADFNVQYMSNMVCKPTLLMSPSLPTVHVSPRSPIGACSDVTANQRTAQRAPAPATPTDAHLSVDVGFSPPLDERMANARVVDRSDLMANNHTKISDKGSIPWPDEETTTYSSFYSSLLKSDTETSSNDDNQSATLIDTKAQIDDDRYQKPIARAVRKYDPPWLQSVPITHELIYRYRMHAPDLEHILKSDLDKLNELHQPVLVNDQLEQLYVDMELEGFADKLMLEEEIPSSEGSSWSSNEDRSNTLAKSKINDYSSMMLLYEDDAPLPSTQVK